MANIPVLRLRQSVQSRGDALGHLESPGDAVLIERGRPRWLLLLCPCGCGEEFPINLDPRAGPAWRLYQDTRTGISVYPSVWRESGCESHYIIWHNKILLFRKFEDYFSYDSKDEAIEEFTEAVRNQLPKSGLIAYFDIAEELSAVPWDVLTICRKLVRIGFAREGSGKKSGMFGQR